MVTETPDQESRLAGSTFGDRLRLLRTELFGRRGQKRFARFVSIPQSSLGKYEKGVSPNVEALRKIVEATAVNANWLLTGDGDMFGASATADGSDPESRPGIEFLGKLAADDHPVDQLRSQSLTGSVPPAWCNPRFFALRIDGDTMEPELRSDDLLVFYRLPAVPMHADGAADPAGWFERLQSFHGAVVVAAWRRRGMIRRLLVDHDRRVVLLSADDPRVLPLMVADGPGSQMVPVSDVQVTGVLRTIIRSAADAGGPGKVLDGRPDAD